MVAGMRYLPRVGAAGAAGAVSVACMHVAFAANRRGVKPAGHRAAGSMGARVTCTMQGILEGGGCVCITAESLLSLFLRVRACR